MIPSVDTRLASISSAITGAILPALADSNPFATEQAQLAAGHLMVLRAQQPYAEEFERLDYNALRAFAREMAQAAEGGSQTEAASAAIGEQLAGPVPFSLDEIRAAHDALAAAICVLVAEVGRDGSDAALERTQAIGIAHERDNAARYRSWFASMGYEDGRFPIQELPELMADFRQTDAVNA